MRILFCGKIFPDAPRYLSKRLNQSTGDEVVVWDTRVPLAEPADVAVPLMSPLDAPTMDVGRFRLIQQWGVGLEGVDLEAARKRGIWVANVPGTGGNAHSVAEHTILLLLALLRDLPRSVANVRKAVLGAPIGRVLEGRTVTLWGLGAIALPLAHRLRPFGVRLLGITRDPQASKVAAYGLDACYASASWEECLQQTDVLMICVKLSPATRNMIGARQLSALPRGAYLINTARGGLMDHDALVDALASGHLAGAGLDVYHQEPIPPEDPLLAFPNVIATPHVAGVTERSYDEITEAVVANIERLRQGLPPLHRSV
jgi:phosphoglycerate dehydrogenase-like enzyme